MTQSFRLTVFSRRVLLGALLVQLLLNCAALPRVETVSAGRTRVDDASVTCPVAMYTWIQAAKLTTGDGADNDRFGRAVAVSGDGSTVVVVAPYHAGGGSERGAAYVYTRPASGWATTAVFTAKLTASDGADFDHLGWSAAVSEDGSTVVVGAPNNIPLASRPGAAYVYVRPATGWATMTETAKLTADDGAVRDRLGYAVAVSGSGGLIVAGAPFHDAGGNYRGAVYVYPRPNDGWVNSTQAGKLTASDSADHDYLGWSVALSEDGNTVVTGVPYKPSPSNRGAAYVYAHSPGSPWTDDTFTAKLTASDGTDDDNLGWSVAVSGDGGTVVAGAPYHAGGGSERGTPYVYTRPVSGWVNATQTGRLTAMDGEDDDYLGWSVAVDADGSMAMAGAVNHPAGGIGRGAVYGYTQPGSGWATVTETVKLTVNDGADNDWFGYAVAMDDDGDTVVASAWYHDIGGTDRGAAYVFTYVTQVFLPLVVKNS
jgi:hypothetical protein